MILCNDPAKPVLIKYKCLKHIYSMVSPFLANALILYLLKTENLWFSGVFSGYKMRILARNWLRVTQ